MNQRNTSFIIEAEVEEGIRLAQTWAEKELGMHVQGNPDVVVLRYRLFSVADARKVIELASGVPFVGEARVVIIAADRAYHEAQNSLLKIFEEPPVGTYFFLVLPTLGGLLPTLRSRVQILSSMSDLRGPTLDVGPRRSDIPDGVAEFLKANKEKRSAIIKKLTNGGDEEKRRKNREEAIALINGIEAAAHAQFSSSKATPQKSQTTLESLIFQKHAELLSDIATLRMHLYDRSAPVRMILEHLLLVTPNNLV